MPAKKAAKKVTAVKKAAPKKAAAEKKDAPVKKKAVAKKKAKPTVDEIAREAYFNYLSRTAAGLPGDPQGDWVAAERSLS